MTAVRGLKILMTMALLSGAILAGCITNEEDPTTGEQSNEPKLPGLSAFIGENAVRLPEPWQDLRVRLAPTGYDGGEPTIGVTSDGTIFTTAGGASLARSEDDGLSWELVAEPDSDIFTPKTSLDPWLWVDKDTDRVYNTPLYVVCTWASWSDDKGETWQANPVAGCGIPAHDHQKITSGPPAEGVDGVSYPSVVYYQYNSFRGEGSWVSVSYDGGETFGLGQAVHPSDCHSGVAGPVAVGPTGTAYLPKPACDGLNIGVSHDSGQSWEVTGRINDAGISPALATTVDADVDEAGNAYAVYTGEDGRIFMTRSIDDGTSWSEPYVVSPPKVNVTAFSVVSAGDEGRIAIGYLGTEADADDWDVRTGEAAPDDTVWHAYMTFSDDALADDPTFISQRVNAEDDPVQIGCIWLSGGSSDCRNLLDFIDMVHHEGRPYMVYADGCDRCERAEESRGRAVVVAVAEQGPSLLEGARLIPLVD